MTTEKKKALVVEDSKALANMLSFLFMSRGIEVITASNGTNAMEKIRESRPDIIITDLMMPEMDGFELCRTIKNSKDLKDIPLIVVSALASEKSSEQLLNLGVTKYFRKPFEPAELVAAAEKALGISS